MRTAGKLDNDDPEEVKEAEQMLTEAAQTLGIQSLMTPDVIDRIYAYTGGHAYVMRVVVGEI